MCDRTESKLYSPERWVQRFINRYSKEEMSDRIEFKLYSPFNKGEEWVQEFIDSYRKGKIDQDFFYSSNLGIDLGYEVKTTILINGVDIVDIVLNKAKQDFDLSDSYKSPGALYKVLTKENISFRRALLGTSLENIVSPLGKLFCWRDYLLGEEKIYVLEEDSEQFVYWYLIGTGRKPITEKKGGKPIQFKFAREQYREALDHLQQLIGKDIDKSQLTKPLLIERLKIQLYKLKKWRIEEKRRQEKEQADEKLRLEIEEKLKEAEGNGTDVIGAFELGKLYYQYLDYDNALLWFKKAAEMGSVAKRSKAGGSTRSRCDRIKFDLFYYFNKEYDEKFDNIIIDEANGVLDKDYLRRNGRPHDIATEIYINGVEILKIMAGKWRDDYIKSRINWGLPMDYIEKCADEYKMEYAHLSPGKLFDSLINQHGFMGGWNWREDMPVWKDGGIVRNILRPYYTEDGDCYPIFDYLTVSEKEDDKFVYWRIMNPYEIDNLVEYSDEADKYCIKDDTTGENDLFFKFAKEQYYAELAKLAKWCDAPELNRTMWLERLADILVTRQVQLLDEEEDRNIEAETDGNEAYETGSWHYENSAFRLGTEQEVVRALKWFHRAADLGNTDAMLSLGAHYLFGYKDEPDEKLGMAWLEKARKLGVKCILPKHLPPEEREFDFETNWARLRRKWFELEKQ